MRACLLLVCLVSGTAAQTYIVDWRGGGHYTDLATAVATVPSGAVLRVRPGIYGPFTLANKSLTILGDDVFVWTIDRDVLVGPTSPAHRVVIDGVTIMPRPDDGAFHLRLRDLAGPVLLHRVRVGGAHPEAATFLDGCNDVRLVDCEFQGVRGSPFARLEIARSTVDLGHCTIAGTPSDRFGAGLPGIRAVASRLACVDCRIAGGPGSDSWVFTPPAGPGGAALHLADSAIEIYGASTRVTGGRGGSVLAGHTGAGGDGGPGVQLVRSSAVAVGVLPAGGAAGTGTTGNGRPGVAVMLDGASTFVQRAGTGPSLRLLDLPSRGGTTLSLSGGAGHATALLLGLEPIRARWPPLGLGSISVQPLAVVGPIFLPASGALVAPVAVPPHWPLDTPIIMQMVADPVVPGELWASNPVSLIVRS